MRRSCPCGGGASRRNQTFLSWKSVVDGATLCVIWWAKAKTRMGLLPVAACVAVGILLLGTLSAGAQVDVPTIPGSPSSTTTTSPKSPPTTAALLPSLEQPKPAPAPKPPPPPPKPAPVPSPVGVPGNGAGDTGAIPANAGPFPAHLAALTNSVRRTGARNTTALIDALKELEKFGVPREEALRIGMGQFPVGGYANYSHDWWFPRFGPGWRLHQGTDVFAARGTPVRAPADGTIRWAGGGLGGIAAYVVQSDGTYFYLAHLDRRPEGQRDGQAVKVGDTVGYVGTSGNAEGGTPHLHFEYHPAVRLVTKGKGKKRTTVAVPIKVRPGAVLPAVDPKPFLDLSLQNAMGNVGNLVATYRASHDAAVLAAASAPPAPAVSPGDALAGNAATQLGGVQAAGQLSPTQTLARFQLAALAFVLILLVASLTPVLAPGSGTLPGRRRAGRRGGDASEPPPPAPAPEMPTAEPEAGAAGGANGRRRRRTGVAARVRRTPA